MRSGDRSRTGFRTSDARGELGFALAVTLGYLLLVSLVILRHEMWRDELQAWMIARESGSLLDLYANSRFEGHAPLWFLVLFVLSRVTREPIAMQLVHVAIASASVFILSWRAPLPRAWRALLPFGYFLVYDFAVVSRPYGLGMLLLFAWCALRVAQPRAWVLPALVLALLANTSVLGCMLAAAAYASMLADMLQAGLWRERRSVAAMAFAAVLLFAGALLAVAWMQPPKQFVTGGVVTGTQSLSGGVIHAALIPPRVLLPVPDFLKEAGLWTSNLTLHGGGNGRKVALALVGALLLGGFAAGMRRRHGAIVMLGVFTVGYLVFAAFVFPGRLYHHGHLFLALIAAMWLAGSSARLPSTLVLGVLGVQLVAGAVIVLADLTTPFSGARAAADLIARQGRAGEQVIVIRGHSAAGVSGYLDRPLLYVDRGYIGTFTLWNARSGIPADSLEHAALRLARGAATRQESALLLTSRPLAIGIPGLDTSLLGYSNRLMAGEGEAFYVYRVTTRGATSRGSATR